MPDDFPTDDDDICEPFPDPDRDQDAAREDMQLLLRSIQVRASGLSAAEVCKLLASYLIEEVRAALPSHSEELCATMARTILDEAISASAG